MIRIDASRSRFWPYLVAASQGEMRARARVKVSGYSSEIATFYPLSREALREILGRTAPGRYHHFLVWIKWVKRRGRWRQGPMMLLANPSHGQPTKIDDIEVNT